MTEKEISEWLYKWLMANQYDFEYAKITTKLDTSQCEIKFNGPKAIFAITIQNIANLIDIQDMYNLKSCLDSWGAPKKTEVRRADTPEKTQEDPIQAGIPGTRVQTIVASHKGTILENIEEKYKAGLTMDEYKEQHDAMLNEATAGVLTDAAVPGADEKQPQLQSCIACNGPIVRTIGIARLCVYCHHNNSISSIENGKGIAGQPLEEDTSDVWMSATYES